MEAGLGVVTRFAPSPTGRLHLGHVRAAVRARDLARADGGQFLLRIEDIDAGRCREEFVGGILDDLEWLGIAWDGQVRRQSAHMADYAAVLEGLRARGLVYRCGCSRGDIAAAVTAPHAGVPGAGCDPYGVPLYPGTCRGRAVAEGNHAWRLDMGLALAVAGPGLSFMEAGLSFMEAGRGRIACDPARFGDVVLARRDTPASYHLCVTHDDAAQGVTLVTRGVDLLAATDLHRLLQVLMGWPEPRYAHHALLTDGQGRRLAKRDQGLTVATLRAAGCSAAGVLAMADAGTVQNSCE